MSTDAVTVLLIGGACLAVLAVLIWAGIRGKISGPAWLILGWLYTAMGIMPLLTAVFSAYSWAKFLIPGFLFVSICLYAIAVTEAEDERRKG